jgi:UDP-N-acetylglucosamine acyltransferase
MNPGTEGGGMQTTVGDHCLFMVGAHVAHDCRVGSHVIMANNATLAGHVDIGDCAVLGGLSAVHQFVRIGQHAMIGGMSGVEHDVIPYGSVMGDRARLAGLNVVGLKRRNFSRDDIHALRAAYRMIFAAEGTMAERIEDAAEMFKGSTAVMDVVDFIRADSSRAICQPRINGER